MPTITHEGTTWTSEFTIRDEDGDVLQRYTFEAEFAKLTPQNALSSLARALEQRVELLAGVSGGLPEEGPTMPATPFRYDLPADGACNVKEAH
jgi:hypothetical protein